MKRIALTILNIIFGIIVFVMTVISSMIIRNNDLSDFFTHKRISALDNRPKEFTHDIIVDLSTTVELGGVLTLTENILQGIMKKRPNWRLILLISELTNNSFQKFAACNQVKMVNVRPNCSALYKIIFHFTNSITFGLMRSKLEQIAFYENLFADDKCDMFWDPAAGSYSKYPIHIPSVCTIHDLAYKDIRSILNNEKNMWQAKCMEESIKKVESIITVSDFSKRRIIEEFKLPADMIEVIHIKMANRLKKETPNEIYEKTVLRKYDLKSKKYLIFISTLWPHKNHDRLLKAFEIFLKDPRNAKIKDIKLTVVGNGTMKKTLFAAKELKIENEVVAPGFVSEKELDIILKHALAFIHPSLYEGFGMPIIEAMAAGVPIASSTAGSLKEIGGDAVLFFDPYNVDEMAEAIRKITIDPELRKSLIKLGHKRAKYFEDNDAMINSYIRAFEKTMASRNTAH